MPELHRFGDYDRAFVAEIMTLETTRAQRRFDNIKDSAARSLEEDRAQTATVLFAFRGVAILDKIVVLSPAARDCRR